jgi:hypothetical protein
MEYFYTLKCIKTFITCRKKIDTHHFGMKQNGPRSALTTINGTTEREKMAHYCRMRMGLQVTNNTTKGLRLQRN